MLNKGSQFTICRDISHVKDFCQRINYLGVLHVMPIVMLSLEKKPLADRQKYWKS